MNFVLRKLACFHRRLGYSTIRAGSVVTKRPVFEELPIKLAKYRFDLAEVRDDDDLRAVLAATPMPGMISVGFRREPSYFGAAVVDGRFRQVVVARDETAGRIVAFGARSVSDRYVNGFPKPIGYLSNLRVLPEHRRGGLVGRGYALLRKLHEDRRTSLYLTTIAQDNLSAVQLLTAGRANLPTYHLAGCYHTAVIGLRSGAAVPAAEPSRDGRTTSVQGSRNGCTIEIRPAQNNDVPAILEFLHAVGSRRQFFPCYERDDFFTGDGLLCGLRPEDLLLAWRGNRLVGTLAAWDQTAFRQIVVHAYKKPLCWLRPLYNCWTGLLGRPCLPRPGSPLRCLMGALPMTCDDDPEVLRTLLDTLIRQRSGQSWDHLLVGVHESDPLLPVLREYRAGCYTTQVYLACWEDGEELRGSIDGRPWYLELGSL